MKFLFLVQGEGRGHLTQAISLQQLLHQAGHSVVQVLVGTASERQIPSFFYEQIQAPVQIFKSPNLVFDEAGNVDFFDTFVHHLCRAGRYGASLRQIHEAVQQHQPDAIINFYEVLGGLYSLLYRPAAPIACVGHHYLFFHTDFQFPPRRWFDRLLLLLNTKFTAIGAQKLLALSFREMPHQPERRVFVTPPLLRREIKSLSVSVQDYWLVYVNYPHFVAQVEAWHAQHPNIKLHCFYDNKNATTDEIRIDETLTFHKLNGEKFLKMMANCRGLVTTAGFESVCEAMYLDKPTLMVPAHFEQSCNAVDAQIAGAGVGASTFDLSILANYLPEHQPVGNTFKDWYNGQSYLMVQQLESLEKPTFQTTKRGRTWPKLSWPRRASWRLGV
jgi:uncharacterized protein (TIGR00661 family)